MTHTGVSSDRLDLVPMTLELKEVLLRGDRESAQRMAGYRVPVEWPQNDAAVRRFRASVSPDNLPSRRLVAGLGFIEVGNQWDEDDGEESVLERSAGQIQ